MDQRLFFGAGSPLALALQPPSHNASRTIEMGGIPLGGTYPPTTTDLRLLAALAGLSIASLLGVVLLHADVLARLSPRWLRPFAAEKVEDTSLGGGVLGGRADEASFHPRPSKSFRTRWTVWTLVLGLVAVAGLVFAIVPLALASRRRLPPWGILEVVPWFCAVLVTAIDRPVRAHRILLFQYAAMILASAALYSAHFLSHTLRSPIEPFRAARVALAILAVAVITTRMPVRDPSWDAGDIGDASRPPSHLLRSPEDNLTLAQFWTMSWVNPLARVCRVRELVVEDVWQLPLDYQHARLYLAFRDIRGRLIPRLLEANGLDLCVSASLAVVERVAEVSNIRLTSRLYGALDRAHSQPSEAAFWCVVMLCVDALRQLAKTTANWYSRKAYERSRGETFIGLFSKLLTRAVPGSDMTEKGPPDEEDDVLPYTSSGRPNGMLARLRARFRGKQTVKNSLNSSDVAAAAPLLKDAKTQSQQPASNAKVVNLVRGDTYEISQRFWDFPRLVSQPVKVVFTMYYLVDIMGWPSTVGVGIMVFFLAVNSLLVSQQVRLERARTALSDRRAQAVAHFVEASRPLKLNGWTASWSARIMAFREREMRKRLHISYLTALMGTANVIGGALYPLASIVLYTLVLGRGLPNEVIWPSLQLFGHLETSVKEAFDLISAYWRATIPVERVNKYMEEPDRDDDSADPTTRIIRFDHASFSWPSTSKLVLEDLTFDFPVGLTVVRGHVGAGKSSLLLAALNEMQMHGGRLIRPDEPVGYAQQLPWLQNRTIRENIVFHQHLDPARYRQVLHACALAPDLASFQDGDQTKLEEGGVGLSGGQKARVALARAMYSPCRILLLDDPLAALDHDTASTIVQRFLGGPLAKDRTIVMVTHRDDLVLRIADQVIDVVDGKAHVVSPEQIRQELEHPYHGVPGGSGASSDTAYEDAERHDGEILQDSTAPAGIRDQPEEAGETGGVSMSVFTKYMKAGGWYLWVCLAVFYGLTRLCDISRASLLEVSKHLYPPPQATENADQSRPGATTQPARRATASSGSQTRQSTRSPGSWSSGLSPWRRCSPTRPRSSSSPTSASTRRAASSRSPSTASAGPRSATTTRHPRASSRTGSSPTSAWSTAASSRRSSPSCTA